MESSQETGDKIYDAIYHQARSRVWHILDLLINHYLDNMEHCAYSQVGDNISEKCYFIYEASLITETSAKRNFDIIKEKNAIT